MKSQVNLVDSGYLSPIVVAFCKRVANTRPCKGSSTRLQGLYNQSKHGGSGVKLVNIDTIQAKIVLNNRVNLVDKPNSPEVYFSEYLITEWYRQFTAEKMITKRDKGKIIRDFIKIRDRNEALDCYIYAYVAMKLASPVGMLSRYNRFNKGIGRMKDEEQVDSTLVEEEIGEEELTKTKSRRPRRRRPSRDSNPYTSKGWSV